MSVDTDDAGIEDTARDVRKRIGTGVGRLQADRPTGEFNFEGGVANISSPFSVPTGEHAGFLSLLPGVGLLMTAAEFLEGAGIKGVPDFVNGEQRGDDQRRRKKRLAPPKKRPSPFASTLVGDDSKKTLLGQ